MSEILPIPKLPLEIKDASEKKELAIFIGAGVSRLYGCDGWDELANRLVNSCFDSKNAEGKSLITFKEKEYLSGERNRKKVITICKNLLYEAGLREVYYNSLKEGFLYDENLTSDSIYDYLFKMGLGGGLYVTTNADSHFSHKFKDRLAYKLNQLTPNNIDSSHLYHLHGSIEDVKSLVFTVPEYLKHYSSDNKQYLKFLKEIFLKYTVLFVGYGLDELEILEFMAAKTDLSSSNLTRKRFLLFPLYKGEENILRNEKSYFKSFGIEVIAFQKDMNGYEQLVEVVKAWSNEIDQTSSVLVNNYKEIEDISGIYNKENSERLMHLIAHDKPRELHFFKVVATSGNPSAWLKFLKGKGYFSPAKSPLPVESTENEGYFSIPHWHVLDYLDTVATHNELNPDKVITKILKNIIKENCVFIKNQKPENRNYRTEWILVKIIGKLPSSELAVIHIKHLSLLLDSYWDNTLIASELAKTTFSKLVKTREKEIILGLFKLIISSKLKENSFGGDYISILDDYWLKELLDNNIEQLSGSFPLECLEILIKHIGTLYRKKSGMFGTVWIPDIEGRKNDFPDKYQVQLVLIAKSLIDSIQDKKDAQTSIDLLEKNRTPIIKRLLIYCYTKNFGKLKKVIWDKISSKNPLNFTDGKREVFVFFLENAELFNKSQILKILDWIERIKFKDIEESARRNKIEAYAKKEWLSALISAENEIVLKKYNEYDLINPASVDHPGYSSWMESGWVTHSTPFRLEDLKGLTISELIEKVSGFKEEKTWRRDAPSKEGLASTLELLVEDDPTRFVENVETLFNLDPYYLYHIFIGLKKAPNEKMVFSWPDFLKSVKKHLENGFKWSHEDGSAYSYSHAYLKEFFSFITGSLRNKNSELDISLEPLIKDILIYSLERYSYGENLDRDDVVSLSINTMPGYLLESSVVYLLWVARNKYKDDEVRWDTEFKQIFTKKLKAPHRDREFSATLGKFFRNMLYLDNKWVWSNFNLIFPKSDELIWKDTVSSLLFYMNNVYDDIYKKLKLENHYSKALKTKFFSEDINTRVIEHICVAYLFSLEDYEESMLKNLINENETSVVKKIIWFFSRRNIEKDEEKRNRISNIWKNIFNKHIEVDNNESKKIILSLASLQKHFDNVEVNFNMLKHSFLYCSLDHYPFEPFEIIQKYIDEEPSFVGDLILKSIEGGFYFSYKEEILKTIIEKMYQSNQRERANKICIAYLAKGIGWPREIYEQNNE